MNGILNKFVIPNKENSIHRFPEGGYIIRNYQRRKNVLLSQTEFINNEAKHFFVAIDGRKRLRDIFQEMYGSIWKSYKTQLLGFIKEAVQRNDIDLTDYEIPRKMLITGSDNHFYPLHISIELTYQCQLKCKHCYANSGPDVNMVFIDYSRLISFLEELAKKGLRIVELTGGEPFLYPKILDLIEFCTETFDSVAILTNGFSINDNIVEFLSKFKEKLLVNVSLDASNAVLHDKLRGRKGAFKKATNAIKLLSEKGFFVRVTMSVYPDTVYEIEPTIILAKKLGAKKFAWNPVLPFGRGKYVQDVANDGNQCQDNEIQKKLLLQHKDFIQWFPHGEVEKMMVPFNCGAGWRSVVLDPYGNLRPCLYMSVEHINLGNIGKQSIDEIFSQDLLFKLYRIRPPREETCSSCRFFKFCKNCIARGFQKSIENYGCRWTEKEGIYKIFKV